MKILIINGPNLNMLGVREPEIYGKETMDDILLKIKKMHLVDIEYFQSNHEGDIIDKIWSSATNDIILNAGGLSHYSISIRDAISGSGKRVVEVHLSDVENRESFRKQLVLKDVCAGFFSGYGSGSYVLATNLLLELNS